MNQPGKVANPARGQLNRENNIPLSPCVPEKLVSRDGFSRPVPRQPAHLHTQAESSLDILLRRSRRAQWKGMLFLTFSVLVAQKKLLDTVANPARGLLNREFFPW